MTSVQIAGLLRTALTAAAPALVLIAGLKRTPSRLPARIVAVSRDQAAVRASRRHD
jgi:hypothetical protein